MKLIVAGMVLSAIVIAWDWALEKYEAVFADE